MATIDASLHPAGNTVVSAATAAETAALAITEQADSLTSALATRPPDVPANALAANKLVGYAVVGPPTNALAVSKLVGYAVVSRTNVATTYAAAFPNTLPGPRQAPVTYVERRKIQGAPDQQGARDTRVRWSERVAMQPLAWTLDATQTAAFQAWWETDLVVGAAWFTATWPMPQGFVAIERHFLTNPEYKHRGNGVYDVSVTSELRSPPLFTPDSGNAPSGDGDWLVPDYGGSRIAFSSPPDTYRAWTVGLSGTDNSGAWGWEVSGFYVRQEVLTGSPSFTSAWAPAVSGDWAPFIGPDSGDYLVRPDGDLFTWGGGVLTLTVDGSHRATVVTFTPIFGYAAIAWEYVNV